MKKTSLILTALLCLAVAVPASAGSRHPQKAKIMRLSKTVKVLRRRLHNMTLSRNSAQASLATAQAQVATLQGQLASANSLADKLQAQIDSAWTPLAIAVEQVRREVWHLQYVTTGVTSPLDPQYISESAMEYVFGHVSSYAYGYLEDTHPGEKPGGPDLLGWDATANQILGQQVGVCGQHEIAFARIVQAFGLTVRIVSFHYVSDGIAKAHDTAEVYYSGGWHFFDPTFGTLYRDSSGNVLSIADARAGLGVKVMDSAAFVNLSGDHTTFETDPATTVTYLPQN